MSPRESDLEQRLINKLKDLKYTDRPDVRDRAALEANFRDHFQALNRVQLTDGEFKRLLDEIVTADVFTAARQLRDPNSFMGNEGILDQVVNREFVLIASAHDLTKMRPPEGQVDEPRLTHDMGFALRSSLLHCNG